MDLCQKGGKLENERQTLHKNVEKGGTHFCTFHS